MTYYDRVVDWRVSSCGEDTHPIVEFLDDVGEVVIAHTLGSVLSEWLEYTKERGVHELY